MDRQGIVLAALAAGGENAEFSPTQVQKVLFLLDREASELFDGPHFDFVPYDYGPYDRTVYDVIDDLSRQGLVRELDLGRYRNYVLTAKGLEIGSARFEDLTPKAQSFLGRMVDWVRSLNFQQLLAAMYRKYPDMQSNCIVP